MARSVYQYEQPRCPDSWNEAERRFYNRLIETLDDIYSKYGRLDERMLSKSVIQRIDNSTVTALDKMVVDILTAGKITADSIEATFANVVSLSAKYGSFDFETVKNLVSDAMVLEKGQADYIHITNLAATYAQAVNATIGNLVIQSSDGGYYQLDVDSTGKVSAEKVELTDGEIAAGETGSGKVIVGTHITAETLGTATLAATQALVNMIDASRINVDTLVAREEFVQVLTANEAFIVSLMANEAFVKLLRTSKIVGDKTLEMVFDETETIARLDSVEVIEGAFAQTERRAGEGIRVFSEIEPKQDKAWGDPWPGGAGKNLLSLLNLTNVVTSQIKYSVYDNEIGLYANAQGSGFQQWYGKMVIPESWRGQTFTFSVQSSVNDAVGTTTPRAFLIENDASGNELGISVNLTFNTNGGQSGSFTVKNNTASFTILFRMDQNTAFPVGKNMWFGRIQLELGSTATSYAPYKNTPAIEGWTGLKATHRGRNLYNKDFKGTDVIGMPSYDKLPIKCKPGITVSWSLKGNSFAGSGAYALFTDQLDFNGSNYNGGLRQWIGLGSSGAANAEFGTFTVPASGLFYIGILGSQGAKAAELMQNLMVVEGAYTAATMPGFESFAGGAYALDFGETVYGGVVDWHAGNMDVGWAAKTLNGTEVFEHFTIAEGELFRCVLSGARGETDIISDTYSTCSKAQRRDFALYANLGINGLDIIDSRFKSSDAFKANLAANPVQIVYKLATLTKIPLTPAIIKSLNGINTVYTDADGGRVEFGHDLVDVIDNVMPPASPNTGMLWLDRSLTPAVLRRWSGAEWEFVNDVSLIESVQDALLTKQAELEAEQKRTALYLKLDDSMKAVRIGQNGVTSEFRIDAFGSGVVVNDEIFSRFEANRVVFGNMEIRKPNVGGLAFDSIN